MSESSATSHGLDSEAPELSPEYRPVSSLAVVALLIGLASVLAFVHPLLWILPAIGVALGAAALRRLAAAVPAQIGRRAALVGLTLSLLFGAMATTRMAVVRWQLTAETLHLGKQWFERLREGNPYAAHELSLDVGSRFEPDDDLPVRYSEPSARQKIEEYVHKPAVRLLLSLGPYAQVRYCETIELGAVAERAIAGHLYAVSVRQGGETVSGFVRLHWTRDYSYNSNDWHWKLSVAEFLNQPPAGWTAGAPAG